MTDRDRSIERLLRHAGGSNEELASQCLDAETLAALADNTMPVAARRDAEMHLADCGRCQALTAAMVRTEAPAGAMAIEVSRTRRALNWLVPAAAAATAVAVWVLVPGQPTPPAAPAISDQQTSAVPPAAAVEAERRDSPQSPARRQSETAPAPTANLADRLAAAPAELGRTSPAAPEVRQEALKLEESVRRDSAGGSARSRDDAADRQASAPAAPSAAAEAPRSASPPAVAGSREASADGRASGRAADVREADAVAQQRTAAFSVRAPFEIASPNPRIRWRIGPAGTVQRTDDQGVTWTSQQIGVAAVLTAGSSPSPDVCWLVGRGGIVLRTVDAGRSWQRTTLPGATDATSITASTGLDAVVALADNRRLATSDGGGTWSPVP